MRCETLVAPLFNNMFFRIVSIVFLLRFSFCAISSEVSPHESISITSFSLGLGTYVMESDTDWSPMMDSMMFRAVWE